MTKDYENLGEMIRAYRKRKNITQEHLGEQIGISGTTILKYEKYKSHIPLKILISISDTLGIEEYEIRKFDNKFNKNLDYSKFNNIWDLTREARAYNGLTQKQLAQKVSLTVGQIQNFERHHSLNPKENLLKVLRGLDIPKSVYEKIVPSLKEEFDPSKVSTLGELFKMFRTKQFSTIMGFSKKYNLAHSTYSHLESGRNVPSIRILRKVANALSIPEIYIKNFIPYYSNQISNSEFRNLGDVIRQFRKEKSYSQQYVGEKLDRASSVIGTYERNVYAPPISVINELSKILDIPNELILKFYPTDKILHARKVSLKRVKQGTALHWKEWNLFSYTFKALVDDYASKNNRLPKKDELYNIAPDGLVSALRFHGGLIGVYRRLGYTTRAIRNQWSEFSNIKKILSPILEEWINKYERLPRQKELFSMNLSGLVSAVTDNYGGLTSIFERLGYKNFVKRKRPFKFWKNEKNIKNEINKLRNEVDKFRDKHGILPSFDYLREKGYTSLYGEIIQHRYGGLRGFYISFGYLPIETQDEFKKFIQSSDFSEQSRKVIEVYGGNTADIADILSVLHPNRIIRKKVIEYLRDSSIRDYIGTIKNPDIPLSVLIQTTAEILPHDKEDLIWNIFLRRASEYRDKKLGSNPTKEQRQGFLKELDDDLKRLYPRGVDYD